eukprot:CAMPEP_0176259848 /NCGR_PEP_ID=MMETSP0121_2-20121125/39281_1 /TAXON_ID=160619 /ORGANISM="Kryptoperidinium foliaceum, Strain CCMP 1326" /LENGTH=63 /DNA_ID=CAMNT_0017599745 /DNA_START=108 /DNA_END=296 /DNA_ORIENTATION=+
MARVRPPSWREGLFFAMVLQAQLVSAWRGRRFQHTGAAAAAGDDPRPVAKRSSHGSDSIRRVS